MSKKIFGFDKLIHDAAVELEAMFRAYDKSPSEAIGISSPIEKLFDIALRYRFDEYSRAMDIDWRMLVREPWEEDFREEKILYFTQCIVFDRWPIDFVIAYRIGSDVVRFAVECDGHDFHERTKEQASRDRHRDRELQARGFRVFRFTGSEIYRDPLRCATEVYKALIDRIVEIEMKRIHKESGRAD